MLRTYEPQCADPGAACIVLLTITSAPGCPSRAGLEAHTLVIPAASGMTV